MGEIEFHVSVNADVVIPEWLRAKMGLIEVKDDAEDEQDNCPIQGKNWLDGFEEVHEAVKHLQRVAKDYGITASISLDVDDKDL